MALRRHVLAFFQGNRFLVGPLVEHVLGLVAPGPVIDLYAGVGLFGLSAAARQSEQVVLVEGDAVSGRDLTANAEPFGGRVRVERFLEDRTAADVGPATVIVDPPRTGLSKAALAGLLRLQAARIVYVSCDPATLARDARGLLDGEPGYTLSSVQALDLFPNTAHIETVALFER